MEGAFLSSPEEALKHFQVTEKGGLTEYQVGAAAGKFGRNGKAH